MRSCGTPDYFEMGNMIGWLVIILMLHLFTLDLVRYGWRSTLISAFWVFTLFYVLSYPVKYLFIVVFNVPFQAPIKPETDSLTIALIFSFFFWLLVYLFRRKPKDIWNRSKDKARFAGKRQLKGLRVSTQLILIAMVFISLNSYYELLEKQGFYLSLAYEGNAQNEARVGSGHVFLLFVLYIKAFFIGLFFYNKKQLYLIILVMLVVISGFLEMTLLGTRRPLYLIVYAFLLWCFMREGSARAATLLAIYPVVMAALSPVGQILRYSLRDLLGGEIGAPINLDYILVSIGSTFEGVEHLANFMEKLNVWQLLVGVDQGISWLFNSGLSLVPRVIWDAKPYLYGSVAQQYFIYPLMYESGYAQATYPPGIVVDAMYGFGVVGLIPMAYLLAKVLSMMDKILFIHDIKPGLILLLAAVSYIHIFNLVRGGTAIIMMIVMLLVLGALVSYVNRLVWLPSSYGTK